MRKVLSAYLKRVDRVDAGEDIQTLADDYRLDVAQIEDAVLYEKAA